jgi:hypothetical protein
MVHAQGMVSHGTESKKMCRARTPKTYVNHIPRPLSHMAFGFDSEQPPYIFENRGSQSTRKIRFSTFTRTPEVEDK